MGRWTRQNNPSEAGVWGTGRLAEKVRCGDEHDSLQAGATDRPFSVPHLVQFIMTLLAASLTHIRPLQRRRHAFWSGLAWA